MRNRSSQSTCFPAMHKWQIPAPSAPASPAPLGALR